VRRSSFYDFYEMTEKKAGTGGKLAEKRRAYPRGSLSYETAYNKIWGPKKRLQFEGVEGMTGDEKPVASLQVEGEKNGENRALETGSSFYINLSTTVRGRGYI